MGVFPDVFTEMAVLLLAAAVGAIGVRQPGAGAAAEAADRFPGRVSRVIP